MLFSDDHDIKTVIGLIKGASNAEEPK